MKKARHDREEDISSGIEDTSAPSGKGSPQGELYPEGTTESHLADNGRRGLSGSEEEACGSEVADELLEVLSGDPAAPAPTEIRLFGPGVTSTKKGDFLFDDRSAAMVAESLARDGRDLLPFDIGHGMLAGKGANPDAHKAGGWFRPTIKDDPSGDGLALFASYIEWTEAGSNALSSREFRFFSPAVKLNRSTRRITGLINCALTNVPASNGQRPIVLDSIEENSKETHDMKIVEELTAALSVGEDQVVETVAALSDDIKLKDEQIVELSSKLKVAEAQVIAHEAAAAKAERQSKIEALSSEGKLAPAQHEFAASLSDDVFEQFVATLSAPVVNKDDVVSNGKVEDSVALSAVELDVISHYKGQVTPEAFLETKNAKSAK